MDLWFNWVSSWGLWRKAHWHFFAAFLCKTDSLSLSSSPRWPSKVYFCQVMTVIMNALHCFAAAEFAWIRCIWTATNGRSVDRSESDQWLWKSRWIVRFPTSLLREEVEVPPYQSVLQRLQLPLDCLTFFINSQVIQFPWQQFPADTKNQVSPWKLKRVVGKP